MKKIIAIVTIAFSFSAYAQQNNKGPEPVEVENGPNNPVPVVVQNPQTDVNVSGEVDVSGSNVNATILGAADVNVANVPDVVVSNTPSVVIANGDGNAVPVTVQNSIPSLAPGPMIALGLSCTAGPNQNGIACDYQNPLAEGVIVTHIAISPLVSIGGTSGTVCRANAGVGGSLIDHSWAADHPLGTHIVLPFSVQVASPRIPRVFVSKTGDVTKSCAIGAVFYGYSIPN